MANNPLGAMLDMREGIRIAIEATEDFQYEEFNLKMKALHRDAVELFREFDKHCSDPT